MHLRKCMCVALAALPALAQFTTSQLQSLPGPVSYFTPFSNRLLFVVNVNGASSLYSLSSTPGALAGPEPAAAALTAPQFLVVCNNRLYMSARILTGNRTELFSWDGTAPAIGVAFANAGDPTGSNPVSLTCVSGGNSSLLTMGANYGTFGRELAVYNTATGAVTYVDVCPGSCSADPGPGLQFGAWVYHTALIAPVIGRELLAYNPSTGQMRPVLVDPGGSGSDPRDLIAGPPGDTRFYFRATAAASAPGTTRLFSFAGIPPVGHPPNPLEVVLRDDPAAGTVQGPLWVHAGVLYTAATSAARGQEVYRVVPSLDATSLLLAVDLVPGISSSAPSAFASFGGQCVFLAFTAVGAQELWTLTGSSVPASRAVQPLFMGPATVRDGPGSPLAPVPPAGMSVFGGALYFAGRSAPGANVSLWRVLAAAPSAPPTPSGIPAPSPPALNSPQPSPAPVEIPAAELEMSLSLIGASFQDVTADIALALEEGMAVALGVDPFNVLVEPAVPLNGQPLGVTMLVIISFPAVGAVYGMSAAEMAGPLAAATRQANALLPSFAAVFNSTAATINWLEEALRRIILARAGATNALQYAPHLDIAAIIVLNRTVPRPAHGGHHVAPAPDYVTGAEIFGILATVGIIGVMLLMAYIHQGRSAREKALREQILESRKERVAMAAMLSPTKFKQKRLELPEVAGPVVRTHNSADWRGGDGGADGNFTSRYRAEEAGMTHPHTGGGAGAGNSTSHSSSHSSVSRLLFSAGSGGGSRGEGEGPRVALNPLVAAASGMMRGVARGGAAAGGGSGAGGASDGTAGGGGGTHNINIVATSSSGTDDTASVESESTGGSSGGQREGRGGDEDRYSGGAETSASHSGGNDEPADASLRPPPTKFTAPAAAPSAFKPIATPGAARAAASAKPSPPATAAAAGELQTAQLLSAGSTEFSAEMRSQHLARPLSMDSLSSLGSRRRMTPPASDVGSASSSSGGSGGGGKPGAIVRQTSAGPITLATVVKRIGSGPPGSPRGAAASPRGVSPRSSPVGGFEQLTAAEGGSSGPSPPSPSRLSLQRSSAIEKAKAKAAARKAKGGNAAPPS